MGPGDADDVASRLVYADYLQANQHHRGELIALQHARMSARDDVLEGAARAENQLLHEHRMLLLAGIDRDEVTVRWRLGYIDAAYFSASATKETIKALLNSESGQILRHLAIERRTQDDWHAVEEIIASAKLHSLSIWGNHAELLLLKLPPELRRLVIHTSSLTCADTLPAQLTALTSLRLRTLDDINIEPWIQCTGLTNLSIDSRRRSPPEQASDLKDLSYWLPKWPLSKLETLSVTENINDADETSAVCQGVIDNACFGQLKTLSLVRNGLAQSDAALLVNAGLEKIEILDLDSNRIESFLQALNALDCDVHYGSQSTSEGRRHWGWGKPMRNRDRYQDPEWEHSNHMGILDSIKLRAKESVAAALAQFDAIPATSIYRLDGNGGELVRQILRLLTKGAHFESILQVCQETPPRAKTESIVLYEILANIVCGRPDAALAVATGGQGIAKGDIVRRCFNDWAQAQQGDLKFVARLRRRASRPKTRWDSFALAHVVQTSEPSLAADALTQSLEDVSPVSPRLPSEEVTRQLFAEAPACLAVIDKAFAKR